MLEKAKQLVYEKYEWVTRKDWITPYINHLEDVVSMLTTEEDKAIWYLHDIVEDGLIFGETICDIFWYDVYNKVMTLTRWDDQTYMDYIKGIKQSWLAHIKIADIVSNISDNPTDSQKERYKKAMKILL